MRCWLLRIIPGVLAAFCLQETPQQLGHGVRLSPPLSRVSPHNAAFVFSPRCACPLAAAAAGPAANQTETNGSLKATSSGNAGGPYPFDAVERHWVAYYSQRSSEFSPPLPPPYKTATVKTSERKEPTPSDDKYYVLSMIPYPSGSGLHMGHCYTYTLADVAARYQRLRLRAAMQRRQQKQSNTNITPAVITTLLSNKTETEAETEAATETATETETGTETETETEKGTETKAETEDLPPQPNVLHAIGWDSFGLPAEQHARERGEAPASVVSENIKTFRRQLQRLGISVDWRREITTSDPSYFHWTQWGFLQMIKRGLAYEAFDEVTWCPALGTVLAKEELTAEGLSERGRFPVEARRLRQWHLRLRAYAERLLSGLSSLEWPEDVLQMQRNWIGKAVYVHLKLAVEGGGDPMKCLLIAPEYLFGCTGVVIHPRHPIAAKLGATVEESKRKESHLCSRKKDCQHQGGEDAVAFPSGVYVHHPLTNKPIPVIVSNVMETLPEFGLQLSAADAFLVAPAHQPFAAPLAAAGLLPLAHVATSSQQSFRAPAEFKLSERCKNKIREARDEKVLADSATQGLNLNGKSLMEAREAVLRWFAATGRGDLEVRYRLKDWVFSRQRYWGEPIPVLRVCSRTTQGEARKKAENGVEEKQTSPKVHPKVLPLPEHALPLTLPPFRPELASSPSTSTAAAPTAAPAAVSPMFSGRSNNGSANEDPDPAPALSRYTDWVWQPGASSEAQMKQTVSEVAGVYRETCTMPQWAGSSWYHLRFPDPHNRQALARKSLLRFWLPVDLYVGGKEHAVTHLIYARFWHKVLRDIGAAPGEEPFRRLLTPGVILGAPQHFLLRRKDTGAAVSAPDVELSPAAAASALSSATATGAAATAAAPAVCGFHRPSGAAVYPEPLRAGSSSIKQTSSGTWVVSLKEQSQKGQTSAAAATEAAAGVDQQGEVYVQLLSLCEKMSKSRGNAVSPDSVLETQGADALRIHLMALGPVASTKFWREEGLLGATRLLRRIWNLFVSSDFPLSPPSERPAKDPSAASTQILQGIRERPLSEGEKAVLSPLVSSVTRSLDRMQVNRAVSALMQGTRQLQQQQQEQGSISVSAAQIFLTLLHPLAPFITEELWARLSARHTNFFRYPRWSLAASGEWPEVETKSDGRNNATGGNREVGVSVQLNGRHRLRISVGEDALGADGDLVEAAKLCLQVQERLRREEEMGKTLKRVVASAESRFVNFVFN